MDNIANEQIDSSEMSEYSEELTQLSELFAEVSLRYDKKEV